MSTALVKPEVSAYIGPVSPPFVVEPAHEELVYAYGFEDYEAVSYPAVTAYTQGFESFASGAANPDGWTGAGAQVNTITPRTGSRALALTAAGTLSRDFTGLTPGRSYTLRLWVRSSSTAGTTVTVSTGAASTPAVAPSTTAYTEFVLAFTASAATQTVTLTRSATVTMRVDDVALTSEAQTVIVNDGLDGWSSGVPLVVSEIGVDEHALTVITGGSTTIARAFSGLVVGHLYTLRGQRKATAAGGWVTVSQSFTAASTAQAFSLPSVQPEGLTYWDDVELIHHVPPVTSPYAPLPISEGRVTLDENYAPYAMATVDVPLENLALLERIDPRQSQRVTVVATEVEGGSTRTFDFGLRGRTVDHKSGRVSIELASDEALLIDKRRLASTVDNTPRTFESSLRAVCNWALGKVGAVLAPGTTDADVTAAWSATNMFPDPSAENATLAWTAGSGAPTFTRQSSPVWSGSYALRISATAAQAYINGPVFSATAGRMYTASFHIRSSVARSARVLLRFMGANGSASLKDAYSTASNTSTTAWQRRSVTSVAPPGTTSMQMYVITDGNASGNFHYIDGIMLNEGILEDWFSGGTANTAQYTYEWTNTANDSSSIRTPITPRPPELFGWKPGQSLYDFLRPLLEASGLRLYCDELRVWRLIDPTDYEVPGYVVVQSGHNATEGTDTISRNTDEWATGVVVHYAWTAPDGSRQERYDFAGSDDKVLTVERESEYPGPGAAAYILNSITGRGRVQDVTALVNFGATPAQDATINLPGTLAQTGKVRRVVFGLASGLMELGTRGLTDTLPGSWAAWNPDETWSDVAPTLAWKDA